MKLLALLLFALAVNSAITVDSFIIDDPTNFDNLKFHMTFGNLDKITNITDGGTASVLMF